MSDKKYLIWSNEHGAWWRPGWAGYTNIESEAGRYDKKEAMQICKDAAIATPEDAVKPEVMFLAPEHTDD